MSEGDRDVETRLTDSAAAVAASITSDESEIIRRCQATDRTYELVSDVLRGYVAYDDLDDAQAVAVAEIVATLDDLTNRWRTPDALVLHRGQRSLARSFGDRPRIGRIFEVDSFLSTTIHRHVAVGEFTEPPGPDGPVLLDVVAPAGTRALWVPPVGDSALAYQGELILPRRTRLRIDAVDTTADILTVNCEVLLP